MGSTTASGADALRGQLSPKETLVGAAWEAEYGQQRSPKF